MSISTKTISKVTYNGINIPLYQTTAFAYIDVTYPSGSTCTCSDGTTTLTASDTSGKFVFGVPSSGTWTVHATSGSQQASQVLNVTTKYSVIQANLAFDTEISTLLVGTSVFAKLSNVNTEFLIVHQGRPSTSYDSSCNGTWLLMKNIYETRMWDSSNNDYKNSDILTYLNGTFLNLFDNDIKNAIQQIKLPYWQGTGSGGSYKNGSNGLSTKVFLLSGYEVGFTKSQSSYMPGIGAKLSYFESGTGTSAKNKRKAILNGSAVGWWLRSPDTSDTAHVFAVISDGDYYSNLYYGSYGVRPALVLSSTTLVDENNNIIG